MDTVLPMLSARKICLESKKAYFALVKLFSAVSPTVFRPVDPLLKVLFTMPPPVGKNLLSVLHIHIWLKIINFISKKNIPLIFWKVYLPVFATKPSFQQ